MYGIALCCVTPHYSTVYYIIACLPCSLAHYMDISPEIVISLRTVSMSNRPFLVVPHTNWQVSEVQPSGAVGILVEDWEGKWDTGKKTKRGLPGYEARNLGERGIKGSGWCQPGGRPSGWSGLEACRARRPGCPWTGALSRADKVALTGFVA